MQPLEKSWAASAWQSPTTAAIPAAWRPRPNTTHPVAPSPSVEPRPGRQNYSRHWLSVWSVFLKLIIDLEWEEILTSGLDNDLCFRQQWCNATYNISSSPVFANSRCFYFTFPSTLLSTSAPFYLRGKTCTFDFNTFIWQFWLLQKDICTQNSEEFMKTCWFVLN